MAISMQTMKMTTYTDRTGDAKPSEDRIELKYDADVDLVELVIRDPEGSPIMSFFICDQDWRMAFAAIKAYDIRA